MDEVGGGAVGGVAQGAGLGAIAGGPMGAAIGGGLGLVGGAMGGKGAKKARNAAAAAAAAQQREAGKYFKYQSGLASRVRSAMNDPQELAMLTEAMGAAERDLSRQEEMINALDPALKAAAAQAFELLQGKEAASLAPLRAERQRQRQTLLNTLRAQLGPGAENSSAGQQALNRFDAQTSNVMASQQQSTLSNLFTMADKGVGYSASGGISNLATMSGARSGRALQGIGAESNLMGNAYNARIGAAGGQYVGGMMQGQYQNQLGGQLIGAAGGLASLFKPKTGDTTDTSGGGGGSMEGDPNAFFSTLQKE
jgi:hypothetical protein